MSLCCANYSAKFALAKNFVSKYYDEKEFKLVVENESFRGNIGTFWINLHIDTFSLDDVTIKRKGVYKDTIVITWNGMYQDSFLISSSGIMKLTWDDHFHIFYDHSVDTIALSNLTGTSVFYKGDFQYEYCKALLEYLVDCHKSWVKYYGVT